MGGGGGRHRAAEPEKCPKPRPSLSHFFFRSEFYPGIAGAKHPSLRHDLQPSGKKLVFSFRSSLRGQQTHRERERRLSLRGGEAAVEEEQALSGPRKWVWAQAAAAAGRRHVLPTATRWWQLAAAERTLEGGTLGLRLAELWWSESVDARAETQFCVYLL